MKTDGIRHKRLHAFYKSKVINALVTVAVICLLSMRCVRPALLPAVCGATALLLAAGYSLWLWTAKPQRVVTNGWLSDVTGWYVIYCLIVNAMKAPNDWWFIAPAILGVVLLFVAMVNGRDETFEI